MVIHKKTEQLLQDEVFNILGQIIGFLMLRQKSYSGSQKEENGLVIHNGILSGLFVIIKITQIIPSLCFTKVH